MIIQITFSIIRVLELRENSLTSLPRSMERLTSLTRIDLSQNQFTEVSGGQEDLEGGKNVSHKDMELFGTRFF